MIRQSDTGRLLHRAGDASPNEYSYSQHQSMAQLLCAETRAIYNIPCQSTSFIGREEEQTVICDLLSGSQGRLLTLTGPGGIGKTRLALEIGARLHTSFPDGVCFVPLALIGDPRMMFSQIARMLAPQEIDRFGEQLRLFLREKHLLLLLDNFEQILPAATLLLDLLKDCPRVSLIITSRTALRIEEELEFPLPSLSLPSLSRLPACEMLIRYPSVALLVQRTQARQSDFTLNTTNAHAIAEICIRLDGLPLALELAAAHLERLSPQQLLQRLEDQFPLHSGNLWPLQESQPSQPVQQDAPITISPPDAHRVSPSLQKQPTCQSHITELGLTKREMDVLRQLAQGLSNAQIADALVLSQVTVHSYLRSIYSKLGVTSRTQAMRYALDHHLL